jgi:hypothetical protein
VILQVVEALVKIRAAEVAVLKREKEIKYITTDDDHERDLERGGGGGGGPGGRGGGRGGGGE